MRKSLLKTPHSPPTSTPVPPTPTVAAAATHSVSLEEWNNPLGPGFVNRKGLFFPAPHSSADRKRRPSTPFEDAPFHAVPLGVSGFSEDAFGLLLVAGSATLGPDFHW